jgi:hypothetical protein
MRGNAVVRRLPFRPGIVGFYVSELFDIHEDPAHFLTGLLDDLVFVFIQPTPARVPGF